jgi:hypothetical protein
MTRAGWIAAASLLAMTVAAQAAPERIRGTVESVSDSAITVKTADGTKELALAGDTKFVWVVPSSLDEVKDGKFIGTATKGENPPKAVEVVVFPASMNGTAEGHYAWDAIEDKTGGDKLTKTKMTNGTIKSTGAPLTKTKMTNGTIKSSSGIGGDKMIDVTYDNGQELKIAVPSSAPIVAFDPADKSIVTKGATVFAVAAPTGGKLDAKLVAVGKGDTKPPM